MITLTEKLPPNPDLAVDYTLLLTAEERVRSRHCFQAANGDDLYFNLPRGTVLRDGDIVRSPTGVQVRVQAKPEPVLVVTSDEPFRLMRAAYHLGNRHVSLELHPTYLQLSPDPVLADMLQHLGVEIAHAIRPFQPEAGAYHHHH